MLGAIDAQDSLCLPADELSYFLGMVSRCRSLLIANSLTTICAGALVAITFEAFSTQASEITVHTRPVVATAKESAQDYLNNWNAALRANPVPPAGYGEGVIKKFDEVQTHIIVRGGSTTNISVFYNIEFYVPATFDSAPWEFRFAVDFGLGGAVFLDGKPVTFNNKDLEGSNDIQFERVMEPGIHNIKIYGQENCCDGFSFGQIRSPGGLPLINNHVSNFSTTDGWSPPVENSAAPAQDAPVGTENSVVLGQEAPVRVEIATDQAPIGCYSNCPERGMQWGETEDYVTRNLLVVQSTADNLTVTDIIVNRGTCGDFFTLPPQTLKFGESLTSPVGDDCKPIEVIVQTSMGEWKFNF